MSIIYHIFDVKIQNAARTPLQISVDMRQAKETISALMQRGAPARLATALWYFFGLTQARTVLQYTLQTDQCQGLPVLLRPGPAKSVWLSPPRISQCARACPCMTHVLDVRPEEHCCCGPVCIWSHMIKGANDIVVNMSDSEVMGSAALSLQIGIEDFRVMTESFGMQLDDDSLLALFSRVSLS